MRRFIKIIGCLSLFVTAFADTTTTRIGLTEPTQGSIGWAQKLNNNFSIIDSAVAVQSQSNTFTNTNSFSSTVLFPNLTPNQCLQLDANHQVTSQACITPPGSDTQVIYNQGGTFAGDPDFTFNGTTASITGIAASTMTVRRIVWSDGSVQVSSPIAVAGANGRDGSSVYPATATAAFPFGASFSTATISTAAISAITDSVGTAIITTSPSTKIVVSSLTFTDGTVATSTNSFTVNSAQAILNQSTLQSGATFYVPLAKAVKLVVDSTFTVTGSSITLGTASSQVSIPTLGSGPNYVKVAAGGTVLTAGSIQASDIPTNFSVSSATVSKIYTSSVTFADGSVLSSTSGISGSGGGSSVYPATATVSFPFGFSASTGVFSADAPQLTLYNPAGNMDTEINFRSFSPPFSTYDAYIGLSGLSGDLYFTSASGGQMTLTSDRIDGGGSLQVTSIAVAGDLSGAACGVSGTGNFSNNVFMNQNNGGYWLGNYGDYATGVVRDIGGNLYLRSNSIDQIKVSTSAADGYGVSVSTGLSVANLKVTGTCVGCGGAWGAITGTLSSQTDLWTKLSSIDTSTAAITSRLNTVAVDTTTLQSNIDSVTKNPITYGLNGGGIVISSAVASLQMVYVVQGPIKLSSYTVVCDSNTSSISYSVSSTTYSGWLAGATPTSICASACPAVSNARGASGSVSTWQTDYIKNDALVFDITGPAPLNAKWCNLQVAIQ